MWRRRGSSSVCANSYTWCGRRCLPKYWQKNMLVKVVFRNSFGRYRLPRNDWYAFSSVFNIYNVFSWSQLATAKVGISFRDHTVTTLKREQRFTLADLLSRCGGLLGLFLGISAISCIEFIYYFSMRWFCTVIHTDQDKSPFSPSYTLQSKQSLKMPNSMQIRLTLRSCSNKSHRNISFEHSQNSNKQY